MTAAQRAAVTHGGEPLFIVGGAGTGKSRTLVERFLWLTRAGTRADRLLLLTVTSASAADLRARIEAELVAPFEDLRIETFADFARALLHAEAAEAGLDPFFSVVSAGDRLALLLDELDLLSLRQHEIRGNPAPLVGAFVERIDRLKEEMVGVSDYTAYADALAVAATTDVERADARRAREFAAVYARHEEILAARGALDGGDLVVHAFQMLRDRDGARARVGEQFAHVLVDEYEDASFAERALLRAVAGERGAVSVASDDAAAIRRSGERGRAGIEEFADSYPHATTVRLEQTRLPRPVVDAALAVLSSDRCEPSWERLRARRSGEVRFWRCRSERAQAQEVAAETERLLTSGVPAAEICVLVRSVEDEAAVVASALEERGLPFRVLGAAAFFQRAEVRDVLAWLRLLADPGDSGAVVRALTRPPIELRPVDIARLTQLSRRRKLDMIAGIEAALESPQLSPEGRDRALAFMRVYRSACRAFEEMAPDLFVHRLVERIGLRRQQVFAGQAETVERLVNIAKLSTLAREFMRREPGASAREFARYAVAVAEAGLAEPEAAPSNLPSAVRIASMASAKGIEAEAVFVLGVSAASFPGSPARHGDSVPAALRRGGSAIRGDPSSHETALRHLLYVALTRARRRLVLSFAETDDDSRGARPSPYVEAARERLGAEEEVFEERLFGPGEGLHATFRMMRDELLDSVSQVGGRLAEMRLDTYLDVSQAVVRYLELVKLAALIERTREGQDLEQALSEVNGILLQEATPGQRELFARSALDDYLRDSQRDERRRRDALTDGSSADTLEPFIPRRGNGLMLSASDLETYRLCPLKYKFARVFRIPQEPTINQRFGIVLHQVLERFHAHEGGSLEHLMRLFEASWRRAGFGDSSDDRQFHKKATDALRRYFESERASASRPASLERSFAFRLGPHLLRGRVDRVDRLPDGSYELVDYKTGKPKTARELREDLQLSLYQMGAREAWGLETSAQSYYYVLEGEKVPVRHTPDELERVRGAVAEIADEIMAHNFEPKPSPELCSFCDYRIACPAAEK